MSTQEFLFDKRIVARNVAQGLIEQKVVDKMIASLPDRESNAVISTPADAEAKARAAASDDADDDEE